MMPQMDIPPGPPAPREGYSSDRPPPVPFEPAAPGPRAPNRVAMIVIGVGLIGGVIAGVLIARSGDEKPSAVRPGALPAGWKAYTADEGFSLGLPAAWQELPPGRVDSALDELRGDNPELAELIEGQLAGSLSSLVKFFAFDAESPTLEQEFATNANVVVEPLPEGVDFDEYLQANLTQLRQVPGVSVTPADPSLNLPGGRAALIKSRFSLNTPAGPRQIDVTQYLFLKGRRGFILSLTTTPEHEGTYASVFEQIARTFRTG